MSYLVLVVEDHPFVRKAVRDTLIAQGLSVVTAESVSVANRLMMARDAHFAILVTDVNLPDGTGWSVARKARHIWPQLLVLYMSAEEQRDFDEQAVTLSTLLPKPFESDELMRALACLGL